MPKIYVESITAECSYDAYTRFTVEFVVCPENSDEFVSELLEAYPMLPGGDA